MGLEDLWRGYIGEVVYGIFFNYIIWILYIYMRNCFFIVVGYILVVSCFNFFFVLELEGI